MNRFILLFRRCLYSAFFLFIPFLVAAQSGYSIKGRVRDALTEEGIPFAYVVTSNNRVWTTADKKGYFELNNLSPDSYVLTVTSLGYSPKTAKIELKSNIKHLVFDLQEHTLALQEVVITAKKMVGKSGSSSYIINRTAIDHLQAASITDVMALLPGSKFRGDLNLTNSNSKFQLRGNDSEIGSASFGTAVEIDGVRLNNNAAMGQMSGIDNRNISVSNIEHVEVVTGVPSVEYGDLTNGLVKMTTKKGRTPLTVEVSVRPNTQIYSIQKGFNVHGGALNATAERAVSIANISHPYTSYDRNGLTLNYNRTFLQKLKTPLMVNIGASGNIGGFDASNDPDQKLNNYQKASHNTLRANIDMSWSANKKWITKMNFSASANYSDKKQTTNEFKSSTSSQEAIHSMTNGYFVANKYENDPTANVILRPPGSWYELRHQDEKPLYLSAKLKAESNRRLHNKIYSRLMVGAEYAFSKNYGQGTFYEDMKLAPTWRPFVYKDLPALNSFSFFAEENLNLTTTKESSLRLMVGLRGDATHVDQSAYGTVAAFSPRLNANYIFYEQREAPLSSLSAHASWGKAVKLPSFNVLYPRPTYYDFNSFTTPSDHKNMSYTAYLTHVTQPIFNPSLSWQSNYQTEIGVKATLFNTLFNVLVFRNTIHNTYEQTYTYQPFSHKYVSPASLFDLKIPSENRVYSVDQQSGIVSVSDKTGRLPVETLRSVTYNKFSSQMQYINGTPIERRGIEWSIDFPELNFLKTKLRLDGNYYYYKGVKEQLVQGSLGSMRNGSDGKPYKYIGHYIGEQSVSNGSITHSTNVNAMLTTHIPEVRMILSLRLEATLQNYDQALSEYGDVARSYAISEAGQLISDDTDIYKGNTRVITYPLYYSTWSNPNDLIPFHEKFLWAAEHAKTNSEAKHLYNDLSQLIEQSNYLSTFSPRTISPYYSINLNITKELGDVATISFYATNFLNNMQKIKSSWGSVVEGTIYDSGYISRFYYGISLKIKL